MRFAEFLDKHFSEEQYSRHKILPFLKRPSDIETRVRQKLLLRKQEVFNQGYQMEMEILSQMAEDAHIRIAFMKGLPLAAELYQPTNQRLFSDMDILVEPKDLRALLQICKQAGYHSEQLDDFDSIDESIRTYLQDYMHHFPVIGKNICIGNEHFVMEVEIHTYVYVQPFHQVSVSYRDITRAALDAAVPLLCQELPPVYVLNACDGFLALVLHMTKHLFYDVMTSITGDAKPAYWNLQQWMDVDLYWEKHRQELAFGPLFQRAIEWDIVPELFFTLRLMATYRPDDFAETQLEEFYREYRRPVGFVAAFIDILRDQTFLDLLSMSSWELARFLIGRMEIDYPILNSYDRFCYLPDSRFWIDEYRESIDNHFHTHWKGNRRPTGPDDFRCRGASRWNNQYFYLLFCVEDDEFVVEDGTPHPCNLVDCMELHFVDFAPEPHHAWMLRLDVHLCIDQDKASPTYGRPFVYLRKFDSAITDWSRCDPTDFTYTFIVDGNNYILELGLGWDMIRTCISAGRLFMDVQICDCDNKPPEYESSLAWASNLRYCGLYDITSFGCVNLKKCDIG